MNICSLAVFHMLDFRQLHELYGKWDREAGFDRRPKSDFLMRALLREYRQKPPRCKWLGWDMKPLEKWEYEPPTLMDVAEKVKEHLDNRTGEISSISDVSQRM